ncbi:MAG TPA: hypothetical protein VFH44_05470 [Solirubrobacterales bacterium]|nr:hypothetical protein [Solirubrobacterales bacterium]
MGPLRRLPARETALAWYGALGGIGAWILHFTAGYWYAEGACSNANAVASIEPVVIGLTVVLGAACALSGVAAFATWRGSSSGRLPDPRNRLALMGAAGVAAAIVFTFAIVLEGIQVSLLDVCAQS